MATKTIRYPECPGSIGRWTLLVCETGTVYELVDAPWVAALGELVHETREQRRIHHLKDHDGNLVATAEWCDGDVKVHYCDRDSNEVSR